MPFLVLTFMMKKKEMGFERNMGKGGRKTREKNVLFLFFFLVFF
jgi:hypothetical protein